MPSKSYKLSSLATYNGSQEAIEELNRANETIANLEEQLQNADAGVTEVINGTVSSLTDIDDGGVIRAGAFDGCENLTSYSNKLRYLTSIGENAFRNCSSLTTIPHLSSDITFGVRSFQNCSSLPASVWPSEFSKNVPSHCFEGSSIGSWISFSGPIDIKDYAFRLSQVLIVTLYPYEGQWHDRDLNVWEYAFEECTKLEEIRCVRYRDDCYIRIDPYAFNKCTNLTTIEHSEYIDYMGQYAFGNCTKLTSFTFGEGCMVNSMAFYGCSNLRNLTYNGTVAKARTSLYGGLSGIPATTVQCSDGVYTLGSH